jgi:prepilin signal peptidase PulO-like enzyme (type II secretory pathway)
VEPLAIVFAAVGAVWGAAADRIAARWPAHEDGSIRRVDWRSVVVVAFGLVALAAVPIRFDGLEERVLFGAFFAACVLMMATDLDQRVIPNELTLPLIPIGLAVLVWGGDTLVNRQPLWLPIAVAVLLPLGLLALSRPFGEGAFGEGDVKFLLGAGLLLGAVRLVLAVFVGVLLGGVVITALLVARRITLKTFVPYGPFLIVGVVWGALLPSAAGG